MKFNGNTLVIEPPKKPKKITGTRFAAIMGANKWATPFATWCAITRTYEEPFEDTIYTLAGKVIEPKLIQYMDDKYFMGDVKTPTDIYGKDYFKKTYGDFYPKEKIFGGMWDALVYEDGKPSAVIEIKTTKRAEDWENGEAPIYYSLQAALYAYLLGLDDVYMVCGFLDEDIYEDPNKFVPSAENTLVDQFKVSERYPQMEELIEFATNWWNEHVLTGVSPTFDIKDDEKILKILSTNVVDTSDIKALLKEAEAITKQIDTILAENGVEELKSKLDDIKAAIKDYGIENFRDGDTKVSIEGESMVWEVSKSVTSKVNTKSMKNDGIFDKYAESTITYKLTNKSKGD